MEVRDTRLQSSSLKNIYLSLFFYCMTVKTIYTLGLGFLLTKSNEQNIDIGVICSRVLKHLKLLKLSLSLDRVQYTSWWTFRHIAIFPSNFRVSGITPRSIRGTAIWITTHVEVILSICGILRNPPVTMRTL